MFALLNILLAFPIVAVASDLIAIGLDAQGLVLIAVAAAVVFVGVDQEAAYRRLRDEKAYKVKVLE
jgi:hypothetical protein